MTRPPRDGTATNFRVDRRVLAVVVATLVALATFKQPYWPTTWLDEGFVTNGAETLVRHGLYGHQSAEGIRIVDQPLVANGPGVVVPVAVAMKVLGIGLWQARTAAIAFMVVCGVLVFLAAGRLAGTPGALAALLIAVTLPREGFLYFGRMAMGNVPALVYLLGGTLVWMAALDRRSGRLGLCAGLLFGLAASTKAQWSVVLLPALFLVWAIDRLVLRERRDVQFLGAIVGTVAVLGAWYGTRLLLQGVDGFLRDLASVQASARWTVFALEPTRYTPASVVYLLRSGIWAVWVLGLGYALWTVATRQPQALRATWLAAVSSVWLVWYALVSVGWERYAFEPTAIAALLAGAALARWRDVWPSLRSGRAAALRWPVVAVAAAMTVYVAVHAVNRMRDLTAPTDSSAQDLAAHLQAQVGDAELIESWEWQLDVLTDHRVHHPTNQWVDHYTAQMFGGVAVAEHYDWRSAAPAYLIDGPFSKFTGLYIRDLASGCCALVTSRGPYDLYRVRADHR